MRIESFGTGPRPCAASQLARIALIALAVLIVWSIPRAAFAEHFEIRSIEHGYWPDTLRALQDDVSAEGRVIHVVLAALSGRRATCDQYTLRPDNAARAAFAFGACDDNTGATEMRLVQRSALFDHDEENAAATRAEVVLRADVTTVAPVDCTGEVRPSVDDPEHGRIVRLTPGPFEIRPDSATAEPVGDHWLLHSRGAPLSHPRIEYAVYNTRTHNRVHSATADLTCSAALPAAAPPSHVREIDRINARVGVIDADFARRLHANQLGHGVALYSAMAAFVAFAATGATLYVELMPTASREVFAVTIAIGSGLTVAGLLVTGVGGIMVLRHPYPTRMARLRQLPSIAVGPAGPNGGIMSALTVRF